MRAKKRLKRSTEGEERSPRALNLWLWLGAKAAKEEGEEGEISKKEVGWRESFRAGMQTEEPKS